ncbi:hypothetical protein [Microbacterium sp. SS28]|uniref:hypothetical protein n=1 Tax=Microbacterium sp. SS28 TaxID=2919948 RepID=UPI001FA955D1|nr:hypothetical protein [Microbacterium sp. SS28]
MTTEVRTDLEAYRVAIAELPLRAAATREPSGAVVAVSGAGEWWKRAAEALAAGAAAVVVAQPGPAPVTELDALATRAGDTPLVFERALLPSDVVDDLENALTEVPAPSALVVECHSPGATLSSALADALGWARTLGRGSLVHRSGSPSRGHRLALLEAAGGVPVSVVFGTQAGAPQWGRIRLTALGGTLIELEGGDRGIQVTMTDAASRRTLPTRFESPQRLALRRAIEALERGAPTADLADLRRDAALAEAIGR